MDKNYISLSRLRYFLDKLKSVFASVIHTHTKTEIIDYVDPVKSDWNESDENSLSFIEHRTHYTDITEEVILEEQTLSFGTNGSRRTLAHNGIMVEGEIIRVVWDGEIYDYKASSNPNGIGIFVGNSNLKAGEIVPGDPFLISVRSDISRWYITSNIAGDHTFSISRFVEDIHKLDPKYLPDGGVGYTEVSEESIEGIVYNIPLTNILRYNSTYTHNLHIPLQLGQVWTVETAESFLGGTVTCEVQQADDGTFYLLPFPNRLTFTADSIIVGSWGDSQYLTGVTITGVSGIITEKTIHQLDTKYIKDMYYDNGIVENVLVDNQTVSGFVVKRDSIYHVGNPFILTLVEGRTYKVSWDGTEYELVATLHENAGILYIGNPNYVVVASGGDIPFSITSSAGSIFVLTESTADSHVISITEVFNDIKQIDVKYIPSTISRISDVETALSLKQDANQAVLFTEVQELTDEQKAQARNNISILNWKDVPKHNGIIKMADYSKALLENNNYAFDIDEAAQLTSVSNSNWTALAHIGYAAESLAKQATMTEFLVPNFMNILVANYEALNATGVIGDILYLCNGDNAENITVAYCITPHPNNSNYTHALHILINNLFPFIGYIYYNKDTSDYEVPNTRNISTTLNKKNYYADDKAVGDALLLKADKTELAQSDWSQNDTESLDYIKNRTHYEEAVENLILEKDGLAVNTPTTNGCYSNIIDSPPSIPVVGEEYIVYWNNDKYTFIAKQYSDFLISIGNTDLLTGDKTKEPILIMFQVSGAVCIVYSTSAIDVLNLKVAKQETIVHPIDEKYLPTSIQPDWAETDETSLSYIKNKPDIATDDEIIEMLTEMDILSAVTDSDGSILSDENENILLW